LGAGIAEQLTAAVKDLRHTAEVSGRIHLFVAGPGGFVFYLGQQQAAWGPTTVYEFDFEGITDRSYRPSLAFPLEGRSI
jgi:SMODS-associated and fused to various effectors sensor domain